MRNSLNIATISPQFSGQILGLLTPILSKKTYDRSITYIYDIWPGRIDRGDTVPDVARLVATIASLNPSDGIVSDFTTRVASALHVSGLLMGTIADIVPQNKLADVRQIIEALYGTWASSVDVDTIPDVARLVIKLSSANHGDLIVQNFSQFGF